MAQVNPLTREVLIKLVYYGPGLGGKTTTLQRVHSVSPAETRGKIVSLATPVDRTLYFDFLPLRIGPINGYPVRLQLFTVPGQVYFNATRKLVLTGADGVVFVADSQRERQDANLESLQNLKANLAEQNRELVDMPHVLQLNKRDLPNVATVEQLSQSLNEYGAPVFESSASQGEGVLEPLDELVRLVIEDLQRRAVFGDPAAAEATPRQPTFGPAGGGLDESLSRASEELWRHSAAPPAGVRKSEPAPHEPQEASLPVGPPAAAAPHATLADAPPVELGPPLTATPPPTRIPEASPLMTAAGLGVEDRADGSGARTHSSVPVGDAGSSPGAPNFRATSRPAGAAEDAVGGPTWAPMFDAAMRDSVEEVEAELRRGEAQGAVLRCESLAAELLAGVASRAHLPAPERQPLTLAMALGLPGERWLWLSTLVSRAKQGEPVGHVEALEAFALVVELCRLARG